MTSLPPWRLPFFLRARNRLAVWGGGRRQRIAPHAGSNRCHQATHPPSAPGSPSEQRSCAPLTLCASADPCAAGTPSLPPERPPAPPTLACLRAASCSPNSIGRAPHAACFAGGRGPRSQHCGGRLRGECDLGVLQGRAPHTSFFLHASNTVTAPCRPGLGVATQRTAMVWPEALAFVRQRPAWTIGAAVALFFSWPAILFALVLASPVLVPAALFAGVSGRLMRAIAQSLARV
jgi:hypothetical protein